MPAFGTFAHFCLSLPSLSILFRKFCFSLTSSMLPPDLKAPHLCLRHVLSPVMHFVADQCTDCFFLIYCASLIVRKKKKNLESSARKKLIELLALFSFLPIWHSKFHIGAYWHTVSPCVGPLNTRSACYSSLSLCQKGLMTLYLIVLHGISWFSIMM